MHPAKMYSRKKRQENGGMRVTIYEGDSGDREKLRKVLDKYSEESGHSIEIEECVPERQTGIVFPFVEGKTHLQAEDILYVETSRHKNLFYTKSGTYSLYKKLSEIEEGLRPFGFIRVHQSYLVNMRYVERINSYILYLKDGTELPVPKSRYPYVRECFEAFIKGQTGKEKKTI